MTLSNPTRIAEALRRFAIIVDPDKMYRYGDPSPADLRHWADEIEAGVGK